MRTTIDSVYKHQPWEVRNVNTCFAAAAPTCRLGAFVLSTPYTPCSMHVCARMCVCSQLNQQVMNLRMDNNNEQQ